MDDFEAKVWAAFYLTPPHTYIENILKEVIGGKESDLFGKSFSAEETKCRVYELKALKDLRSFIDDKIETGRKQVLNLT